MIASPNDRPVSEFAGYYAHGGLTPIPVPLGSKVPVLDDWTNVSTADCDRLFPDGYVGNVGLLNGTPSQNLLTIDCDCVEVIAAAPVLLPHCNWIVGRESRGPCHYHYLGRSSPKPIKLCDLDNKTLVELRSTGQQTLVPPSVHPSGERYEKLAGDGTGPKPWSGTEFIEDMVYDLAAIALLAQHWPKQPGRRHDLAMALSGGLLGSGYPVAMIEVLVTAVCVAAADEEVVDRVRAVRSTAERRETGQQFTGWTRLAELLPERGPEVVRRLKDWWRPFAHRGDPLRSPAADNTSEHANKKKAKRVRMLPEYVPFPVELLPDIARQYCVEAAAALGCDPAFIALPVIAELGAAIGFTRVLQLKKSWREPCIFWTAVVAESGTLKSPAHALGVDEIVRIQRRLIEEHKRDLERHKADVEQHKQACKDAKQNNQSAPELPESPPALRRVVVMDTTIEKLTEILEDNARGVLVARDELAGWLGSFTRYKGKGGGSDLPNWLEMHRGGTVTHDRKTGDRKLIFVPHAAVSISGTIQPRILARLMTTDHFEAGLVARVLMAMPSNRPKRWTEAEVSDETTERFRQLLKDLLALDFENVDGENRPYRLRFSPEAKAVWIEFYNSWAKEQAGTEGERAAAFSKLEGYAARFALLHHVVTHIALDADDRRAISVASVRAGVALAKWFAQETDRIYAMLGELDEDKECRVLIEFIQKKGGRITVRDLHNSNTRKYRDKEAARAALDALVAAEIGTWSQPIAPAGGGHPVVEFIFHADLRTFSYTSYT